jgi:hypothetical protein
MLHGFYIKSDTKQEIINRMVNVSRLEAAKYFAQKNVRSNIKYNMIKNIILNQTLEKK